MDRQIGRLLQNGEWLCPILMLVSLVLTLWLCRKNRLFVPRGARQWIVASFLALTTLLAGGGWYFAHTANRAMDRRLDALSFRLLADDSVHRVSEFRGKVVLLNFWATWCPPCRKEMPDLERLYATYQDRGLVVITISDQAKEELLKFDEKYPLRTISGYFEPVDPGAGIEKIAITGRPFTMLIDRDGHVVDRIIRYSYEEFEAAVLKRL